jgi:hypothetical protein
MKQRDDLLGRILPYGVLLLLSVACVSEGSTGWMGTVTDSAGVTIVSNPSEGIWTVSSRWVVEEDLRIGTAEGDPDYEFGELAGIAVTPDERIVVLDRHASRIAVFTIDGVLERTFAGAGSGPGELGPRSGPLLLGRGDTLVVFDPTNMRVNRYMADGSNAGSVWPPRDERGGWPMKWQTTASGLLAVQTRDMPILGQPFDTLDAVTRLTSALETVDTLLTFPSGEAFIVRNGAQEFTWFAREPSWALAPNDDIWFGANDDYRFSLYGPNGTLKRVVTRPFDPVPVSQRDQEIFREALENAWAVGGVPPQFLARLRQATHFAEYFPAFVQFFSGPNQSLWVQRLRRPSELTAEEREFFNGLAGRDGIDQLRGLKSSEWDVFDDRGRFLGIIALPPRFQPMQVFGDRIYGIWWDDLDVQYVLRLRVTGVPDSGAGP